MDMFWCVALMLLVSSALNVRKSKGGDVLNREQTEEWKGWMQFMFLMYHYFSAHEVGTGICNTALVFCYLFAHMYSTPCIDSETNRAAAAAVCVFTTIMCTATRSVCSVCIYLLDLGFMLTLLFCIRFVLFRSST